MWETIAVNYTAHVWDGKFQAGESSHSRKIKGEAWKRR